MLLTKIISEMSLTNKIFSTDGFIPELEQMPNESRIKCILRNVHERKKYVKVDGLNFRGDGDQIISDNFESETITTVDEKDQPFFENLIGKYPGCKISVKALQNVRDTFKIEILYPDLNLIRVFYIIKV